MGKDFDNTPLKGVVIGGGSGSPASIKALLSLGLKTTSVVAMADDGGSTGILRVEADVTPPGDIRKCLVAMAADPDDPLTSAFKTRFRFSDNHTLGNLMLVALEEAAGSFPQAIEICARLLGARGTVCPSTLTHVRMAGTTRSGAEIDGQASLCHADDALERVWLYSDDLIEAYPPTITAIEEADLIVFGPGSLFTSIIPNLLVPGVVEAIEKSHAVKVFVCAVADFQGETRNLNVAQHYDALCAHGLEGLVDYILVHQPEDYDKDVVRCTSHDLQTIKEYGTEPIVRDFAEVGRPAYHSVEALTDALREVLSRCRSPKK